MQTLFIYFAVFMCVLIVADMLIRGAQTALARRSYVNYRLSLIEGEADRKIVHESMLKERDLNLGGKIGDYIKVLVLQSGVRIAKDTFYVRVSGLFLGLFVFIFMLSGLGILLSLLATALAGILLLFVFFSTVRTRRIRKFVDQLPDTLDVIVRSLAAGHPLPTSISLVSREMADPIGSEFGLMSDEMTYGTDVDVATRNMARRVGAEELNLLAISLSVQKGSGGNLSEILSNLADIIRKRTMMRAKIRAISAEGRMTSWFMLLFPFGLYGMIRTIRPDYFDPLWESGYGNIFLTTAGVLMVIGMLILRKLVNFDY